MQRIPHTAVRKYQLLFLEETFDRVWSHCCFQFSDEASVWFYYYSLQLCGLTGSIVPLCVLSAGAEEKLQGRKEEGDQGAAQHHHWPLCHRHGRLAEGERKGRFVRIYRTSLFKRIPFHTPYKSLHKSDVKLLAGLNGYSWIKNRQCILVEMCFLHGVFVVLNSYKALFLKDFVLYHLCVCRLGVLI